MTQISFEFFPPRDIEGQQRLVDNVALKLTRLRPEFFSVTYGAGGSTRDGTRQTVAALNQADMSAAPHLSMGNDDREDLVALLDNYRAEGVDRIVALRGDQPSGFSANRFTNNAEILVRFIREHSGSHFHLCVAAYPEIHPDATSASADMDFFARKVEAGANSAITQFFYNPDAYADFLERCAQRNLYIPIVPGIMPITNVEALHRIANKAGAEIPRWLSYNLGDHADNEKSLVSYGVEIVATMCERLIQLGAPGLHFYTLNRWGAATRICQTLGLGAQPT